MASFSTLTESVDTGIRLVAAQAVLAALFIFNIAAMSYPLSGPLKAPLFLMAIYYWAIYRPTLMPAWAVFIAGILLDLLSGLPVGLNALAFVLVQWSVRDQRRFLMGQNFPVIWIAFVLISFGVGLLQWALFGLTGFHWPPLQPLLISTAFGAGFFPLVCIILHLTHKILPSPHPVSRFSSQTRPRAL